MNSFQAGFVIPDSPGRKSPVSGLPVTSRFTRKNRNKLRSGTPTCMPVPCSSQMRERSEKVTHTGPLYSRFHCRLESHRRYYLTMGGAEINHCGKGRQHSQQRPHQQQQSPQRQCMPFRDLPTRPKMFLPQQWPSSDDDTLVNVVNTVNGVSQLYRQEVGSYSLVVARDN